MGNNTLTVRIPKIVKGRLDWYDYDGQTIPSPDAKGYVLEDGSKIRVEIWKVFEYYVKNPQVLQATAEVIKKWVNSDKTFLRFRKTGREKARKLNVSGVDVGVIETDDGKVVGGFREVGFKTLDELLTAWKETLEEYVGEKQADFYGHFFVAPYQVATTYPFPRNSLGRARYLWNRSNRREAWCAWGGEIVHMGKNEAGPLGNKRILVVPALRWDNDKRFKVEVYVTDFEVDEAGRKRGDFPLYIVVLGYLLRLLRYRLTLTARFGLITPDEWKKASEHLDVFDVLVSKLDYPIHHLVKLLKRNWEEKPRFSFVAPASEVFPPAWRSDERKVWLNHDLEAEVVVYRKSMEVPPLGVEGTLIDTSVPETVWTPEEWEALYWSSDVTNYGQGHGTLGEETLLAGKRMLETLNEYVRSRK